MRFITYILFLSLPPLFSLGQTVHLDSNRIVYKGMVNIDHVSKDEIYTRAKKAIASIMKGEKQTVIYEDSNNSMIAARGSIKLASPYSIIKKVEYILELSIGDGKYKYRIDSVRIKQVERGGKTSIISSQELVQGMDESGPVSANTEKQVNEIDMVFQKLLDLLKERITETNRPNNTPEAKINREVMND
jgi:Domain of unknown function (DUF4468) with TBP-like fold